MSSVGFPTCPPSPSHPSGATFFFLTPVGGGTCLAVTPENVTQPTPPPFADATSVGSSANSWAERILGRVPSLRQRYGFRTGQGLKCFTVVRVHYYRYLLLAIHTDTSLRPNRQIRLQGSGARQPVHPAARPV